MSEAPSSSEDHLGPRPAREPRAFEPSSRLPIELIPDGVFILDADWRVISINEEAVRLFGYPREKVLGQGLWALFPGLLDTPFGTAYLRARDEGEPQTVAWHSDQLAKAVEACAVPHGSLLVVFLRDVTARHAAEQAREKSAGRLALLQRMTTKLCAVASAAEVVEVIARGALEALNARRLSVALPEQDGRSLRVLSRESLSGGPGYRLSQVPMESNLSLTRVFRSGRPEWSGSLACLPMIAKGSTLAVLSLTFEPYKEKARHRAEICVEDTVRKQRKRFPVTACAYAGDQPAAANFSSEYSDSFSSDDGLVVRRKKYDNYNCIRETNQ